MKTLVFNMLTIAATFAAMTACTSESDPVDEINPKDAKVEIKLNAGVVNVETKADINYDDDNTATFGDNVKVQLLRWDSESNTYSTPTWSEVTSGEATISGTDIELNQDQKYYDKKGKYAFFIGFYPITPANMTYSNDGTVKYKDIDGSIDILCAKAISAGNNATVTNTDIKFKHMLSQIKLTLKGDAVAQSSFGNIESVTLKAIPQNLDIALGNDPTIAINSTEPNKKDITILNTSTALSPEGIVCKTMIAPSLGKSEETKLTIEIKTNLNETPISIEINDLKSMTSGTTNNINLTFKDKIEVTTSIENWETGDDKDLDYGN